MNWPKFRTQRARWILLGVIALVLWETAGVIVAIATRNIWQFYIPTLIAAGLLAFVALASSIAKWISLGEDDSL